MLPSMTTGEPTEQTAPRRGRQAFQSLPDDWARRPMTDPDLFEGVVDLAVLEAFRALGGLALLLCHADGRLMQPLTLESVNAASPPDRAESILREVLLDVARGGSPAVVIVIARPGSATPTEHDLALRQAVVGACGASGMALLGVALAVPGSVSTLPCPSETEAA